MKIIKEEQANIEELVVALKKGAVLIMPTDTIYGLVCDGTNKKAVEKIYKIKERPKSKPLPIFIKDVATAKNIAFVDSEQEKTLTEKWPGRYTFVLNRNNKFKIYGVQKDTIALRIPDYKFLNVLLEKIDRPLAQTSANISGKPVGLGVKEILLQFLGRKNQPDILIDAGDLNEGQASTIIDLTDNKHNILRD